MSSITLLRASIEIDRSLTQRHPGTTDVRGLPQPSAQPAPGEQRAIRPRHPWHRRSIRHAGPGILISTSDDDIMWRTGVRWDGESGW